jgi:hypothetical protein
MNQGDGNPTDRNRGSGKSPTKFMERPGTQPDEEKDLFQDQSGDEGVNSLDSTLNAGQDPADRATVKGRVPDKDWYRKWQDRVRDREKEGPR